jgi:hypothetical protein
MPERRVRSKSPAEAPARPTEAPMASAAPATPAAAAPPSAAPAKPPRRPRARRAAAGDVAPRPTPTGLEDFAVTTNLDAARESRLGAMQDVISGLPPEEAVSLLKAALKERRLELEDARPNPDEELAKDWRDGGYPYRHLMLRRNYERQKYQLQVELLKLQAWVKETGQRSSSSSRAATPPARAVPSSASWSTSTPVARAWSPSRSPPKTSAASGTSSATSGTCPRR